jgi:hypothetical protein
MMMVRPRHRCCINQSWIGDQLSASFSTPERTNVEPPDSRRVLLAGVEGRFAEKPVSGHDKGGTGLMDSTAWRDRGVVAVS